MVFANKSDAEDGSQRSISIWWGDMTDDVVGNSTASSNVESNIHKEDYVGPNACVKCHKKNHASWSGHSHRWMNALATSESVRGDFSDVEISYLGGKVSFYREDGEYRMRLEREATTTFTVNQTLGSRFYQYYIGRQIDGPANHPIVGQRDHVLPLGYWLEQNEWVPVVHIWDTEDEDGERLDPFDPASYIEEYTDYATACNHCHTTFPLAEQLSAAKVNFIANEVPTNLHWSVSDYLKPSLSRSVGSFSEKDVQDLLLHRDTLTAPEHAVTLGVSCEACHLGCREHVADPKIKPSFFPRSPHLRVEKESEELEFGPTHANVNWACGRCHTGNRPRHANGMATWNSTEYSDAMRGRCYTELRCVDCHNPHESIGRKWSKTPAQDDASCVRCHQQFVEPSAIEAHSHHAAGSSGSHCMDCHMPRMNEGMQDVVRTHMIFSPTDAKMLEANEPNACNQCHVDQPITWTQSHLEDWYGKTCSDEAMATAYPDPDQPVAIGWLNSQRESVRLLGADALFRTNSKWAIQDLVKALDDPYLLNRQFARRGLEKMLKVKLSEFGYRHYMQPDERREPIRRILEAAERAVGSVKAIIDDEL